MEREFKIGDWVIYSFTGKEYKIVGDRKTSVPDGRGGEFYPVGDNDFVLEALPSATFEPYVHCRKIQLKLSANQP